MVFHSQKKYAEAEEYLKKTLAINPENTDALVNLGILYAMNHDYRSAKDMFIKALNINPENQYAQVNLNRLEILTKNQKEDIVK